MTLMLFISNLLTGFKSNGGIFYGWLKLMFHSWGVDIKPIRRKYNIYVDNVSTVWNQRGGWASQCSWIKKWEKILLLVLCILKCTQGQFRESTAHVTIAPFKESYNNLPEVERVTFDILIDRELVHSQTLWDEIQNMLLCLIEKLSYSEMAKRLSGIVSINTLQHI